MFQLKEILFILMHTNQSNGFFNPTSTACDCIMKMACMINCKYLQMKNGNAHCSTFTPTPTICRFCARAVRVKSLAWRRINISKLYTNLPHKIFFSYICAKDLIFPEIIRSTQRRIRKVIEITWLTRIYKISMKDFNSKISSNAFKLLRLENLDGSIKEKRTKNEQLLK